ncbi:MAG: ribosome maturation factor RimM [Deltaproteobacteria bacterium]|nr:ribosome maturation factor RimM [Deltaproteobacteria bacterium]
MALFDRDQLVIIGRVLQAQGLKGELKALPLTSDPAYYEGLTRIFLDTGREVFEKNVARWQTTPTGWIIALEGVASRTDAEGLRGAELLVEPDRLKPLAPEEYFLHDLMGCQVETMEGVVLGRVTGLMETGAHDVLVIENDDGREILLPMAAQVVKDMDMARKVIRVDPHPDLLTLNG